MLGAVLLTALTKYAGDADAQGVGVIIVPPVVVVAPAVVVQDDYVYYPNYGIYYNSRRHQYAYLENGAWIWQPGPEGVSVEVLLASPSVRMDFHDSVDKHHAEMLQKYPKNWRPADERREIKAGSPEDGKKDRDKH